MLENRQEVVQDSVQIIQPPYSPNVNDFDNKKLLGRLDQTERTKGRSVVIDDNAAPRMIKPKKSEVEVQKDNERNVQSAPRPKPIVKNLLDKYTLLKANNVFNRLRGNNHPRSRTQPGGHERWRGKSYNQQPYFPMTPTSWGCPPPMRPQYPPWDLNRCAPYSTWPAGYFQLGWVPSRPMFREDMHKKKARFNQNVRPNNVKPISIITSPQGRHSADAKNYKGGRNLVWVPVRPTVPESSCTIRDQAATNSNASNVDLGKPGEPEAVEIGKDVQEQPPELGSVQKGADLEPNLQNSKENSSYADVVTRDGLGGVARNGLTHGCFNSITAKSTGLHVDLKPNVDTHSEKHVVRPSTVKPTDASASLCMRGIVKIRVGSKAAHGLKIGKYRSAEAIVCSPEVDTVRCGSVQRKDTRTDRKGFDNTLAALSSTSKKTESASIHAVQASLCPTVVKSTTSTTTQCSDSTNNAGHKIIGSNVFEQQRVFSAKQRIYTQRTTVCQYMPRNSGGSRIKSVEPGTKPRPQWCPVGLTHTQKRRVQRLRVSEIREELAKKRRDEWFSEIRPMMHTKRISQRGTSSHI
jgi:hypothetical protein